MGEETGLDPSEPWGCDPDHKDGNGTAAENEKSPYGLLHKGFKFLVRLKRFELLAYRFVACCSIQLSYSRITRKRYSRTSRFRQAFFLRLLRKKEVSRRKNIFIGKTYSFHKLFSGRFLTLISGVRQNGNATTLFPGKACGKDSIRSNVLGRDGGGLGEGNPFSRKGSLPPPIVKTPAGAGAFPRR